jgi:tetratricopeptide (TPR) repeat protein
MKARFAKLPHVLNDERRVLLVLRTAMPGKGAAVSSDKAVRCFHTAVAAFNLGDLKKAIAACAAALDLSPNFAQAYALLGVALAQTGYHRAASVCCRSAIQLSPDFAEAYAALGSAYEATLQHDEAAEALAAAVRLKPDDPATWARLGRVLMALTRPVEAAAAFAEAVARGRRDAETALEHGNALRAIGRVEDALERYEEACALRPDLPEPWMNAGVALQDLGRVEAAIQSYGKALALDVRSADIWRNLGTALQSVGRFEDARNAYETALTLRPADADAAGYLGATLTEAGDLNAAGAAFDTALALSPEDPDIRFNHGLFLLKSGQLAAGWAEHEWRWRGIMPPHGINVPQWQGEPSQGRRILVHWEQGFGDTLQFVRYVPLLAERGFKVVLQVQRPLLRVMESLDGVDHLVTETEPRPDVDLHCPMLSLPFAFRTEVDNIPARIPYLRALPASIESWRDRIGWALSGLKVGLVWAGQSRKDTRAYYTDKRRSIDIAELLPLAAIPNVRWFSLQKDVQASSATADAFAIIDLMQNAADFADTAALIANLDLVVTVDSAVAHLAGALGKRVWMLSRFDGCWRWMNRRDDTPWYPAMRIYRQTAPGDWSAAIARLRADLAQLAATHMP